MDIDDIYVNDKGGLRAGIGAAYDVTFPAPLPDLSTRAPIEFGADDLEALPLGIWSASNDAVASTTAVSSAWEGVGSIKTVVDLGPVGHDATTVDAQQVVAFFDGAGGRA